MLFRTLQRTPCMCGWSWHCHLAVAVQPLKNKAAILCHFKPFKTLLNWKRDVTVCLWFFRKLRRGSRRYSSYVIILFKETLWRRSLLQKTQKFLFGILEFHFKIKFSIMVYQKLKNCKNKNPCPWLIAERRGLKFVISGACNSKWPVEYQNEMRFLNLMLLVEHFLFEFDAVAFKVI